MRLAHLTQHLCHHKGPVPFCFEARIPLYVCPAFSFCISMDILVELFPCLGRCDWCCRKLGSTGLSSRFWLRASGSVPGGDCWVARPLSSPFLRHLLAVCRSGCAHSHPTSRPRGLPLSSPQQGLLSIPQSN